VVAEQHQELEAHLAQVVGLGPALAEVAEVAGDQDQGPDRLDRRQPFLMLDERDLLQLVTDPAIEEPALGIPLQPAAEPDHRLGPRPEHGSIL
jgi:hypothetical protein